MEKPLRPGVDYSKMNSRYIAVLIGACILAMLNTFVTQGIGYFMVPVTELYGFDRGSFSIMVTTQKIAAVVAAPLWGSLFTKHGTRRMALVTGLITALGFVALAFSKTLVSFWLAGALVGVGHSAATLFAATIIINTWFIKKRGFFISLAMACTGIGGAFIGLAVPPIIEARGNVGGFLFLAILFAMILFVGFALVRTRPEDVGMKAYGYTEEKETEGKMSINAREQVGLRYKDALRTPLFYLLFIGIILMSMPISMLTHMPANFASKGIDPISAGKLMSVISFSIIWIKIFLGVFSEKVGLIKSNVVFLVVTVISCVLMIFMTPGLGAVPISITYGFALVFGSVMPPLLTTEIFGNRDYTAIYSIIGIAAVLGAAIHTPIIGAMYDAVGTYNLVFVVIIIAYVVGFIPIVTSMKTAPSYWKRYNAYEVEDKSNESNK